MPSQGTDGGERDAVEAPAPGVLDAIAGADLVVVRMGFSPTYADQDPRVEQLVRAAIDAT